MSAKLSLRDRLKSPSKRPRLASNRPSLAKDHHSPATYMTPSRALPGRYQVEGSDAKGRSVNLSANFVPEVRRNIAKLVQCGEFGFETEQDAVRWSVHFGVEELGRRAKDPDVKSSIRLLQSFVELAAEQLAFQRYEVTLNSIFMVVDKLIAKGDFDKAEDVADKIHRAADSIPDPYWRRKYFGMAAEKLREVQRERSHGSRNT